jgi:enediyne polyketide synthase
VLRGCARGPAAMVRVAADEPTVRGLGVAGRLHIAAYEGPRAHVLTGSAAEIRELTRRAAAVGVTAEVLGLVPALHSPAMASSAGPLRSVLAGTRFATPRRRLVSTVTGRPVLPGEDIAELLARQPSLPVLFEQAITQAAEGADLIVTAGPEAGLDLLAGAAADCCAVPAITVPGAALASPADAARLIPASTVAALFAAGAVTDLTPFLTAFRARDTLASRTVPRMREGEPATRPGRSTGQDPGPRTTARSG